MAQMEHPVDVPFGIHDAGRDIIAAAEIADDRDGFERLEVAPSVRTVWRLC